MKELSVILILLGLSVLLAVVINKYFIIKRKRKAVNKLAKLVKQNYECSFNDAQISLAQLSKVMRGEIKPKRKVIKRKLRYIK